MPTAARLAAEMSEVSFSPLTPVAFLERRAAAR
jgi:hypothetical protein